MARQSRVTVVMSGCFEHPGDMTPIEERYSEDVRSTRYPLKKILTVSEPTDIDFGGMIPRLVIVTNRAGFDEERYPTDEQAAETARQQLYVGPAECPRLCLLHPRRVGFTASGTAQAFWLAPGQRLVMSPVFEGESVDARVLVFPGDD